MPGSPLALYSKHSAGCLGFSQQARQRTQCSKWLISISIFNMDQGKWSIITQQIQSQWNSQPSITEPHCLPVVFLHSSRASMSSQKASLVFTDFTQGRVWFLTQVNLCWRQSLELQHYQHNCVGAAFALLLRVLYIHTVDGAAEASNPAQNRH